jgi:hypothetical protein
MWLVLVAAALSCNPPSQELRLRVVDAQGNIIPGAELREWSGREPRHPLLGVTDGSGAVATCVSPSMARLAVYHPAFKPRRIPRGAGPVVVTLHSAGPMVRMGRTRESPCVTGSTPDGYRFCTDILSRLPLQF